MGNFGFAKAKCLINIPQKVIYENLFFMFLYKNISYLKDCEKTCRLGMVDEETERERGKKGMEQEGKISL